MEGNLPPWAFGLDGLLTLASSTLLVLTFLEALRGDWKSLPRIERRLRLAFMSLFATCVLSTMLTGAMQPAMPWLAQVRGVLIPMCAAAMILFTHGMLWHRRRHPVLQAEMTAPVPDETCLLGEEEERLANVLQYQLVQLQVYREPELKVADLAQRLGVAEHKLSRLITRGLGEKNFNQMLNQGLQFL